MTYDVITITAIPVSCNVLVYPIYAKLLIFVCEVTVVAFVEIDHFCEKGGCDLYMNIILKPSQIVKGRFTLETNSKGSLNICAWVWGNFWENFLFYFALAHARLYRLDRLWMLSYGGGGTAPRGAALPISAGGVVRSQHAIPFWQSLLGFAKHAHKLKNSRFLHFLADPSNNGPLC